MLPICQDASRQNAGKSTQDACAAAEDNLPLALEFVPKQEIVSPWLPQNFHQSSNIVAFVPRQSRRRR
jgi:hypothetical protein